MEITNPKLAFSHILYFDRIANSSSRLAYSVVHMVFARKLCVLVVWLISDGYKQAAGNK